MKSVDQLQVAAQLLSALRSQWWSAAKIRQYQDRALVEMMQYAATHVPFYQELDLRPKTITNAADLARFPLIGKRDVQQRPESFMARGFAPGSLYASRTSGSSGQPTTTYFDRRAWLLGKYALKMRRLAATGGIPLGQRVLVVSEQPPERLGAIADAAPSGLGIFFQQRYLSIHTPVEQHLPVLRKYQPNVLYAFPSYLIELISMADRLGTSVPRVETVYTSSEVLTAAARARIEQAFAGRVYDIYGSTEFKEVAWQCRAGVYHVNFENVYVEAQQPGSCEAVVLSSLCNRAMPLLRYNIGDRAVFGSHSCTCGRASLHLTEFSGREGDMISLPVGRRVSPYLLTTVIESEDSILQYRINQTALRDFRIDVIVKAPGESMRWRERVCKQLEHVLGDVTIDVNEVDRLERAPSGKRSVFVRMPASGG
jgi:phenylacetate-CoA ligase